MVLRNSSSLVQHDKWPHAVMHHMNEQCFSHHLLDVQPQVFSSFLCGTLGKRTRYWLSLY